MKTRGFNMNDLPIRKSKMTEHDWRKFDQVADRYLSKVSDFVKEVNEATEEINKHPDKVENEGF